MYRANLASSATTRRGNGANNENVAVTTKIQQIFPLLVVVSDAIFALYTHCHVHMREIALRTLLWYCGFPSSCNAKRYVLYKHVRAQLFNSGFSVTTTDSQDFKDAYAYNLTATEYYRSF